MTSTGSSRWRQINNSPVIVVITLVIALVGAVTGTISFFREQRVDLHLSARYRNAVDNTLQVGIVNNSSRGVSIVRGEIVLNGSGNEPIGEVVRVLRGVPGRGDTRVEQELFAAAEELPFAIDAGQSLAGTLLFKPSADTKEARARFNSAFVPFDETYKNRIWLRLDFAPGGSKSTRVEIPDDWGPGDRPRDSDHALGWRSSLVLDRRLHVVTIMVAGPEQALGTLQVWRVRDPRPVFEETQPVFETQGVHFHLPKLPSGQYDWAVTVSGRAVIVGNFIQPCTRLRSTGTPAPQGEVLFWDCRSEPRKRPDPDP